MGSSLQSWMLRYDDACPQLKKILGKLLVGLRNCITFAPALVPAGLRKVHGIDVQPPQGQLFKLQD